MLQNVVGPSWLYILSFAEKKVKKKKKKKRRTSSSSEGSDSGGCYIYGFRIHSVRQAVTYTLFVCGGSMVG